MAKKPLTININNADPSKTYDMTNVSKLNLIYDSNLEDDLAMTVSGNNYTLKVCGNTLSYTFKNMTTSMPVLVKKGDSTEQFNGTFAQFYEQYNGHVKWTPTNNQVTGTTMADVINMGSYKKSLTINSGKGNDTVTGTALGDIINGGDGNDVLKGGKGDDTIYAGAGNDKITGGKGKDKIYTQAGNDIVYFNSGDGADTLYKGSGSDTLIFNNFAKVADLKKSMTAKKSGNNLILNYTSKDTVTLSNYYKDGASIKTLKAKDGSSITLAKYLDGVTVNTITGKKDVNNTLNGTAYNDLIKGNNKNDTINGKDGNDKMYGYAGADTIKGGKGNDTLDGGDGNDKLYGEAGNDTIYGGKGDDKIKGGLGNDTINAGAGKNNIYYSLNDGNDTILYGGASAHDTLVFDEGIEVSAMFADNDLVVSYSGSTGGHSYENTITIKDFKNNQSVEYVKIGNGKTKSITEYIHQSGGDKYYSTEGIDLFTPTYSPDSGYSGAKLTPGNHTFVYNFANTHGENTFGTDIIISPNGSSSISYTDTFQFDNYSIEDGDFDWMKYYADGSVETMVWDNYGFSQISYENTAGTAPKLVMKDRKRTYDVKTGVDVANVDNSKVSGNIINLLTGTAGNRSTVIANQNWNSTYVEKVALNYTYNGGHDRVDLDDGTNDVYNVNGLSDTTDLFIHEAYGTNDVINFTNTNVDDIRIIFNVTQIDQTLIPYNTWKEKTFFAYKGNVTFDHLVALENGYGISVDQRKGSIYVHDWSQTVMPIEQLGIETIKINGTAINTEAWYDAVATRAGQWLRSQDKNYWSVSSAATTTDPDYVLTDEQKAQLVEAYKSVKYSDIIQKTVTTGGNVMLAANKFNRYTFSGNYDGATISSGNTFRNGSSDTLIFSDASFGDNKLEFSLANSATAGKRDLCITTTVGTTKKTVKYADFMTGNSSELVVKDSQNRGISVMEFVDELPNNKFIDFGNFQEWGSYNAVFIHHDGEGAINRQLSVSAGGNSKSYLHLEGGIGVYLQQGSGTRLTIVNKSASEDRFNVSADSWLQIEDHGKTDELHISSIEWDDLRAVSNVTATYNSGTSSWEYTLDGSHVVFLGKDNLTADTLSAATADHLVETVGTNIMKSSGTLYVNCSSGWANMDSWYGQIKQEVGSWLAANNYGSVASVVNGGDADDIAALVAAFKSVTYEPNELV